MFVDPLRSPSTSPPPERPHEEFMIPGPLNDDKYRMVDDEFLHIAQRFTAHLHRAEYDRLKALAKTQNAATIREMERPIVENAVPSTRVRQRSESAQRAMKQRKALGDEDGGDDGDDGDGTKDDKPMSPLTRTSLRGLMEAPRRERRSIMPAPSASSSSSRTRAAAGYSSRSSPQQDLRNHARSPSPSPSLPTLASSAKRIKIEPPRSARSAVTPSRNASQRAHANPQSTSSPATETPRGIPRSNRKIDEHRSSVHDANDDLDDDPFGLHERRMNRKKSREQFKRPEVKGEVKQESNKIDLSSIPSFL
ncbi:hypothetical protein V8C37DRAFT_353086 [Trichoderma ceciliae]